MLIQQIKDSVRNALFKADSSIIFHFEEIKHTGFPFAKLSLKDFKISPSSTYDRQKCNFTFELVYQKSADNKISELFSAQETIKNAMLPVISIGEKKITPDDVSFCVSEKKLIMNFSLNFYSYEEDTSDVMQTLDITIKENKNAR